MNRKQHSSILLFGGASDILYKVAICLKHGDPALTIALATHHPTRDLKYSRFIDTVIPLQRKFRDPEFYRELIDIVSRYQIDMLFPALVSGIEVTQKYRDQLQKYCQIALIPDQAAFQTTVDKWRMFRFMDKHHIPTPRTSLYNHYDDLKESDYPLLLKISKGANGKNIFKFNRLPEVSELGKINLKKGQYINQQYLGGYDIDCSVLCLEGEIVAYTIQKPSSVGRDFTPNTSKLDFVHNNDVLAVAEKLMRALKWNGVGHIDLRYDSHSKQVKVIEINPRFWGSILGSLSAGVNFPYLMYRVSTGMELQAVEFEDQAYVNVAGYLKSVFKSNQRDQKVKTGLPYLLADPAANIFKALGNVPRLLKS